MACNGLEIHVFRHPKWCRIIFETTHFLPIFDRFLVPKQPIFKAFWDLRGPERGNTTSKCTKLACFVIPCGPGSFLKTVFRFLHPVDLWHPPLWATSCSWLQPNAPTYGV